MRVTNQLAIAALLFLFVPAASLIAPTHSERSLAIADNPQEREIRNRSAVGVILGEFRTNLSDMIFIKTERYLDSGIAYAPHLDAAEMASSGEIKTRSTGAIAETSGTVTQEIQTTDILESHLTTPAMREVAGLKPGQVQVDDHSGHDHAKHDDHEGHDHEFVPTLIKTADQDFRGFIGRMERNVKPWRDPKKPHKHTAGTELLPWYRLATISDPHNIRNYIVGAWWLKTLRTDQQTREALVFLEEGIRHNPGAFQLYLMKGYVLRQLKRLQDARSSFEKAAELAIKVRPADGQLTRDWDLLTEEQAVAALTMTVLSHRDDFGTTKALELAKSYYPRFPSDPNPVSRLIKSLETELVRPAKARK